MAHDHTIVPREKLDFGLDGDIPKYWFGGDAFKTRFFDAMSTIFPEGERYFISCVRDYRDQVSDPKLLAEIKDFMRQEGQHGIVHSQYNERLKAQGIDVDALEREAAPARRAREPEAAPELGERRLKAEDFERLLERESRLPPAARPTLGAPAAPRETPRSRARVDDDLFDGPGEPPRPGSNPRARR